MNDLTVNRNTLWASLLVEELVRHGVDYFCLAPGSRNAPLTLAVAAHTRVRESMHWDERAVGFHAVGYGRATGRPAVIITTSGTAVANLLPAVIEASLEQIPLLVLTGDRPPELRHTCANQTIDQVKIFGDYVRWFVDLPCPTRRISPAFVLTTVDQAVHRCRRGVPGPVHINCMFREPLTPEPEEADFTAYLKALSRWREMSAPYTVYEGGGCRKEVGGEEGIADILRRTERGVVVVGKVNVWTARTGVRRLAERLQWPVCADITSGFRLGDPSGLVMGAADVLAIDEGFSTAHAPEVVLHLGGRVVSKQMERFFHHDDLTHYILVSDHVGRQDPGHRVTRRVEGDLDEVCSALADQLSLAAPSSWLASWQRRSEAADACLDAYVQGAEALNEPLVARLISEEVPAGHALFLANSTPVRSMNRFANATGAPVCVGANRGASGIDGTLAAAAGFAAGCRRPVTLFMGDLAFLHDLNALNYLKAGEYPVITVVINNNGGGIFSHLPIARYDRFFEKYFVTPHGLTFKKVAAMYGVSYHCPTVVQEFLTAYRQAVDSGGSAIIEIPVNRKKDRAVYMQLIADVHQASQG